jgi:CheY-like chemotaxis protein
MSKIMVVEDDANLREIYSVRITAEGYDVVPAGDGEEALAIAVREKPDLILSDVMMPKISGFDMLDILRSTPETASIKVVMMTALSGDDQRQRGERLGADRYLVKSQVGIEDVISTIHEVLGDAPAPASTEASSTTTAATSTDASSVSPTEASSTTEAPTTPPAPTATAYTPPPVLSGEPIPQVNNGQSVAPAQ